MSRPELRLSSTSARALAALACAVLASCGGGQDEPSPQQRNPAAGVYSGADAFGNSSSFVITPDGYFSFVTVAGDASARVVSVSTGAGQLTPIVFASAYLYTNDLPSGQLLSGLMIGNYRQSASIVADFSYPFIARTITANFLADSFAPTPASSLPSAAPASLYLPAGSAPYEQQAANWVLLPDLSFTLSTAGCVLSGKLTVEPAINVHVASASASSGCAAGTASFSGYLWRDTQRGHAYAVLKPASQPTSSPLVLSIKL